MTICPFCKKAVVNANGGPCPSCGKVDPRGAPQAAIAPAPAPADGDEWDAIERGSASQNSSGPSAYSGGYGGGLGGLGDDDDGGPGLSLELDAPVRSQAPAQLAPQSSQPPHSMQPPHSGPPGQQRTGTGGSGGYSPHRGESMPQPLPARRTSGAPGSDPAMMQHQQSGPNLGPSSSSPVAVQQPQPSSPNSFGPPSSPGATGPMGPMGMPGQMAPGGPPDAAVMIARYPAPPQKWFQTPAYAMRVLYRQFELRQDIEALRKRRSPDVPLYERALKTHDGTSFAIGLAISIACLTVAMFLFFLPVILRFVRDPD